MQQRGFKLILFSDQLDHESDVEDMEIIISHYNKVCDEKDEPKILQFVHTTNILKLEEELIPGCICVVDYGALGVSGQTGMLNALNRRFEKIIFDHPTVNFIFWCTMGVEYYSDLFFEFANFRPIDRTESLKNWVNAFLQMPFEQ